MAEQAAPTRDGAEALYAVAYQEAVRGLTQQAGVLDNVRTRAGMLVAAANVVTAFLAPQAITNGSGFHAGALAAIASFVACLGFALGILWARGPWKFAVDATAVIKKIEGSSKLGISDLHKWLASKAESAWASNQEKIDQMLTAFDLGCICLAFEVACWVGVLAKVNVGGWAL